MTRVNNALVCPNDDVIYAGSECPVCMSRLGHPIRNWICPMNPVVGGHKHEQTVYPSVQKEQSQPDDGPWPDMFGPDADRVAARPKLHLFKQAHVEGTGDGDCT